MYKLIEANKRNTIIIMIAFVALIAGIGCAIAYAFDDWGVAITIFIVALIYALIQYFAASSIAVAMTSAREITRETNRRLWDAVENLTITAGLPMPKVYIIEDPAPNAFASGRDPKHSLVAVTTGLLDIMDKSELESVIAHELSHIKNYDIRVSTITFGLVCLVGFISDIGIRMMYGYNRRSRDEGSPIGMIVILLTAILAPIAAAIAQMAVSREREYLADASSVDITKNPDGMVNALKKLAAHSRPMHQQNAATEAMFITNPLRKGGLNSLFSTHPPIEKRIERLEHGI